MFGQQNNTNTGGFGSSNPVFGASSPQSTPAGFRSITSGQNVFESSSSQLPTFGAAATQGGAVFGRSSGFGQTTLSFGGTANAGGSGFGSRENSSFSSSNALFAGPAAPTSSSAFGTPVTASSMFGNGSSSAFGLPSTVTTTPSFGSLTSAAPFGQSGQSSFGSSNTAFGGSSQFSPFGTVTTTTSGTNVIGSTTTNNPTFGISGSMFGSNTPSSGQTPFRGSTGGTFSGPNTDKSNIFAAVVTTAPLFGGMGSSTFQSPGTTSLFNTGGSANSSSPMFGSASGSFGTAAGNSGINTFSSFTPSTTPSSGLFSSAQGFDTSSQPFKMDSSGFASNSTSQLAATSNSTTSTSVFGCISSTGQPVPSSLTTNMFLHAAPSVTTVGSGIFGSNPITSSEEFDKPGMDSGDTMDGDGPETETTSNTSVTREGNVQKESHPAKSLFSRSEQGEKKLPKSGLFLAAISGIAAKKEKQKMDEKKSHGSIPDKKESESTDKDDRKQASTSSGQRIVRRRSTLDDVQKKVAIVVRSVDASCNNKEFLKKYFQKYGTVKRVFVNPGKESATIHFTSHDEAQAALQSTRFLKPGTPRVQIFWGSHTPRKESTESQTSSSEKKSEVQEELESMQGTTDLYEDEVKILERPAGVRQDDRATEKSNRSKLRTRTSSRSRLHDAKDRSSMTKLKPLRKPVMSAQSKSYKTDKPKKGADHISLKSLANCVANTAAECVEVLENRDKILRMALESKKQIYLATTEAIVGTCPDMCPEKERYLREVRRHLSVYEIVPGTDMLGQNPRCDHAKAVKEYSRSSADQEMPLSHELRPPNVLSMTMDYLMNNIMDTGGDGKWADWYEYLWNRTRSLRKDITQQDLCDCTSVAVIEKNCRFHIYCAERLCEEDMSTFDEKINNENLTKCLQTLKQMYSDLEKKGIFCPHESEFRAYIVLMNLNSGDTLREVQQLREHVRESDAVKFSTKVYSALNCNNYAKFFKLVQLAPFLYGCILHRYFNQVRGSALRTMLKAYRWPGQSPQYPLSDLIRLLQFGTDDEAVLFCHHHGLTVEDGKIYMDRRGFIEPDTALEARRALNLIESKQRGTVGEVVNGGPLPANELHRPYSSFDETGRFIPTDIHIGEEDKPTEVTKTTAEKVQPSNVSSHVAVPSSEPPHLSTSEVLHAQVEVQKEQHQTEQPQPQISNEIVKDIAKQLFLEIINEHVTDISQSVMRDITVCLGSAIWIYDELENCTLPELFRQMAETAIRECGQEHRELVARQKAELSAMKAKATDSITEELVISLVSQECQSLAVDEYSEVKKQLHEESGERISEVIAGELVDRTVQEEVCLVAEMVFEVDVVERLQEMEEAAEAVRLLIMGRFMRRWKNRFAARQSLKSSILTFPPAPSMKTPADQVKSLIPKSCGIVNGTLHLGMSAYATLDSAAQVTENDAKLSYNITLYKCWKEKRRRLAWSPLCLGSILYSRLHCRVHDLKRKYFDEPIYWKLILSLPDVGPNSSMDDDYTQRTIMWCDWLKAKFTKGTVPGADPESQTEVLSLYTTSVHDSGRLRVCVRLMKGFPDEDDEYLALDRTCLLGTSAVMFYVGEADPDHGECYVAEVQSRLQHLLENLPKCCPIPLVMMCPAGSPVTEQNLNMELFLQEDMISGYKFVTVTEDVDNPEYHKKLVDNLHWTTNYCPKPPLLTTSHLLETIEDVVSCHFFNAAYQAVANWHNRSQLHQFPELLISFYNNVISHIADVVSDATLQDLSWPVAEFCKEDNLPAADWNTADQLDFLRHTVLSLQLPEYDRPTEDGDLDCTDLVDHVWAYVAAVADDGDTNIRLFSRVKYLLSKLEQRFGLKSRTCLCLVDWQLLYVNIPWIDIIQACYEERLSQASWEDITSEDEEAQVMAHYFKSKLNDYTPPQEWLKATRAIPQKADVSQEKMVTSVKRKLNVSLGDEHENLKAAKIDTTIQKVNLDTASQVTMETRSTAHALNCLIAKEKRSNKRFEEFLQKSLQDDNYLGPDINQRFGSPEVLMSIKQTSLVQLQETRSPSFSLDGLSHTSASQSNRSTMTDDINELDAKLKSQKQADKLFEMRLKSFLIE